MSRFSFCGPSYASQSVSADCQICRNWYLEAVESQMGKSAFVLYPRPGLNLVYQLGGAPMRGETTVQGRTFAVQGTTLWELLAGGGKTNRGAIASDGLPVSLAGGGTQLLIASQQRAWVYDLKANTLTEVTATIGLPVAQVAYFFGFFVALIAGQNKLQASAANDATTWPGASFTGVQNFTEPPIALFVDHEQLWVLGPKGIQPYYNSGNFPFPFDAIQGGYIENGLGAAAAIAKADNSLFWLDASERGNAMIRRANGFVPVRVSNHAIEFAMQSYATIADCVAFSYQDQGHERVVFSFPTAGKTWEYDAATGQWNEPAYWDTKLGKFTQHRAMFHTFNFGMHLVGDPTTGNVYQMAIPTLVGATYQFVTDNNNPIRRVRRAPHISQEQEWIFHSQLQVDVETGLGPVPPLQGTGTPTTFYLADSSGAIWALTVNDIGILQTTPALAGASPGLLFMNDPVAGTSWQVVVSTLGVLQAAPVTFNGNNQNVQVMVSSTGQTVWNFFVTDVGGGHAVLKTQETGIFARGPQMMMRFSNDGAHTFSQEQWVDCGQAGEFTKRAIWRRLGKARDRVYEIAVTDPIPWRIIDAYLKASPGYGPSERLPKELAKRA
ncbi:MAG TPA: hypothetical protein VMQ17_08770 [Candidatus Sulfotelmatobacter sp.]|nr:hypothetical protein [Candidatus Sulfotelmatobacter sp.]